MHDWKVRSGGVKERYEGGKFPAKLWLFPVRPRRKKEKLEAFPGPTAPCPLLCPSFSFLFSEVTFDIRRNIIVFTHRNPSKKAKNKTKEETR